VLEDGDLSLHSSDARTRARDFRRPGARLHTVDGRPGHTKPFVGGVQPRLSQFAPGHGVVPLFDHASVAIDQLLESGLIDAR
jgi:hypothetical protein